MVIISKLILTFRLALRLASAKLPVLTEFIDRSAPPRLGNLLITPELAKEVKLPDATLRKLS